MINYINDFTNESAVTESLNNSTLQKPYLALLNSTGKIDWNTQNTDYSQNYLTFEFEEGGVVGFEASVTRHIYFKRLNGTYASDKWKSISTSQNPKYYISVEAGDILQFKAEYPSYYVNYKMIRFRTYTRDTSTNKFVETPINFKAYGNIMSLIYGDNFSGQTSFPENSDHNFYSFFGGLGITDASNLILPATTLTSYCYDSMFYNCRNLVNVPALPATTLTQGCYGGMFQGCTSLTTAPALPATTLTQYCYSDMFRDCSSLTTAPELPATTLAIGCYQYMFNGCTSLTKAPSSIGTSATTMVASACTQMFRDCTSLVNAPELPATALAYMCYEYMFQGCTSLTTAPELLAATLAEHCYYGMFAYCSNLNYIKCLATDISAPNCTSNWVSGVAASGTFVKDANTTWQYDIPTGWTVVDAS